MNAKNLLLKFAIVLLMVVLCAYQVFWGKGLRQGIDLRGGHSLTFEIRTNQTEILRLQDVQQRLENDLTQGADDATRKDLQERLDRVRNNIENLREGSDLGDLAPRIINILKRRIDPQGLLNIEWRPLGRNRIEVRMPAGKEEVQQAKNAYLEVVDKIEAGNIQRSEMRRIEAASGELRQELIQRYARGSDDLGAKLKTLAQSHDELSAARAGDDRTRTLEALRRYNAAREAVEKTNLNVQRLNNVLRQYVSPREQIVKSERELRQAVMESGLRRLIDEHPHRKEQIQETVDRYRQWIDARQGLDDPADLKRLIAKAGVLEFRIAPMSTKDGAGTEPEVSRDTVQRYKRALYEEGPEALQRRNEPFLWFPISGDEESFQGLVTATDAGGQRYVLLANQPGYMMLRQLGEQGWSLSARRDVDNRGRPAVGFTLDPRGAKLMARLTGENIGKHMAILLDNEVYSAPVIRARISDSGIIEGRFTEEEVAELVRTLEAGSLPARLNPEPVSESTFGPALGAINLQMALRAGVWGLVGILVFMAVYYMLSGALADLALALNIIFILGTMSWLNAVFTLPGIAGVILSIGMAVDANVLIFERLREEQAKGQSVRMTLKNAYERAFSAIFDGNLTTLITCAILGWVGTEEVRGFAITLGLGIVFNLFTAVFITRWIFQFLLDHNIVKRPLFMLQFIRVPKVAWMNKRFIFYAVSGAMLVLGIGSIAWQTATPTMSIWGIEFSAGTQAVIKLKDDAILNGQLPNDRLVEQLLRDQAAKGQHEKLLSTARVEARINPNQAQEYLATYDSDKNGSISQAEWKTQGLNGEFFRLVDKQNKGSLAREDLEENLPNTMFQITTTETHVDTIRQITRQAYGEALDRRVGRSGFEVVAGQAVKELGITLPDTGTWKIQPIEASPMHDLLEDYRNGVLMVVQKIDPPMTEVDLRQRVRDMRLQPDRLAHMNNPTEIRGLTVSGNKGFSSFAILVRPSEPAAVERQEGWDQFAQGEKEILNDALTREEAMIATNFDPAIAGETAVRAGFAVALSWLAIIVYLWLRFGSARWGLAAVICLIHDITIVTGLVAVSGWLHATFVGPLLGIDSFKIDLTMIAALLTIVGYSVNDTIVVFDRIRENRGKLSVVTAPVINLSINQTLSRTILTSGTTLLVVLIMYIWGGSGIHSFNYALLAGILFGTYSSIAMASPLLMGFKAALVQRITTPESPENQAK
ncbi:MAG: bifunctional preprotein translocase subunit SecD/SecF [Planctomycetes bacterium ADurb.Bin126]|nr:MAG: bifunctional preprotein translocase subunit SecD/SecF [Planctomycetes bacterium ADurb.Bin126]HOD80017.1 protein translocase subunit SecD [Phycisphaerae bacterium]